MAIYSENVKDVDLLSFLRVTYLATQGTLAPEKDSTNPGSYPKLLGALEKAQNVFRTPMSIAHLRDAEMWEHDATHNIAPQSIGAPMALLRLLTFLTKRGVLDKVQSWVALPEGCGPGTDLPQVKQVTNRPVLETLIPLVVKRMAHQREMVRPTANENQWHARTEYIETARLGGGGARSGPRGRRSLGGQRVWVEEGAGALLERCRGDVAPTPGLPSCSWLRVVCRHGGAHRGSRRRNH